MSKDFSLRIQSGPLSGLTFQRQDPFNVGGMSNKTTAMLAEGYSLRDVIMGGLDVIHKRGSYEWQVSENIRKQVGQHPVGVFVPSEALCRGVQTRADLSAGTAAAGGNLIYTEVKPRIADALIPHSALVASKITVLGGLTSNVYWPRWETAFAASGYAENITVTDGSSETISVLQLGPPSRIPVTLNISAQLLKQQNWDGEKAIQAQILRSIGSAVDLYCLNKLLALSENTSGGTTLSKLATGVTMGGAATFAKLVSMKQTVLGNNVIMDNSEGWIISPATYGRWSVIPQVATFPRYLLDNGKVLDAPYQITNNLTAAVVPHTALYGRWSDVVLGIFGIDIVSDNVTGMSANQVKLNINILYDFGVLRGPSIIKTEDSAAQ